MPASMMKQHAQKHSRKDQEVPRVPEGSSMLSRTRPPRPRASTGRAISRMLSDDADSRTKAANLSGQWTRRSRFATLRVPEWCRILPGCGNRQCAGCGRFISGRVQTVQSVSSLPADSKRESSSRQRPRRRLSRPVAPFESCLRHPIAWHEDAPLPPPTKYACPVAGDIGGVSLRPQIPRRRCYARSGLGKKKKCSQR